MRFLCIPKNTKTNDNQTVGYQVCCRLNKPVNEVSDHDNHLNDHKNSEDGSGETWLGCRTRCDRLRGQTLSRYTNIAFDQIQSLFDFVQTILNVIVTDGLRRPTHLFTLILNDGGSSLMDFGDVSSTQKKKDQLEFIFSFN